MARLRDVLGAWRGEGYAAKDVSWHRRGVPGRLSVPMVSVRLTVPEAEVLAQLIAERDRTAPR